MLSHASTMQGEFCHQLAGGRGVATPHNPAAVSFEVPQFQDRTCAYVQAAVCDLSFSPIAI
jgi:hypothetical protein